MADESFKLALGFDGKDFAAGVGRAAKDSDKLAGALDSVVDSADDAKKAVGGLSAGAQKLRDKLDKAANRSKKANKAFDRTGKRSRYAAKGLSRASRSARGAHKSFLGLGGVTNRLTGSLGALAAGAAAVGAFRSLVSSSLELERAMAEVSTIVDTSKVPIQQITADAREMAAAFGIDALQATKSLYQAISAGVTPAQSVQFLQSSALLAQAGLADMKDTTDLLSSALNAYGLDANSATAASDVFFQTVQDGKTTIPELSQAIGQVAPIAASAGVDLHELSAATAALTATGQSTGEAMTGVRSAIKAFLNPSSKATQIAKELGFDLSATNLAANGLSGVMGQLKVALESADAQGLDTTSMLTEMFGRIEGAQVAISLTGNQFDKFTQSLENNRNATGKSQEAAEKMQKTVGGRLKIALEKTKGELGKLGNSFLEALDAMMQSIGGVSGFSMALKATRQMIEGFVSFGVATFLHFKNKVVGFVDRVKASFNVLQNSFAIVSLKFQEFKANLQWDWDAAENFKKSADILIKENERITREFENREKRRSAAISKSINKGIQQLAAANETWSQYFSGNYGKIGGGSPAASGGLQLDRSAALEKARIADEKRRRQQELDEEKAHNASLEAEQKRWFDSSTAVTKSHYRDSLVNEQAHFSTLSRETRQSQSRLARDFQSTFVGAVNDARPALQKSLSSAMSQPVVRDSTLGVGQYATREEARQSLFAQSGSNRALDLHGAIWQMSRGLFGRAPGFSSGGIVGGSGRGDKVAARLEPGEFVVNRKSAQRNLGLLTAINSGNNESMNTAIASSEPSQSTTNTYNNTTNQSFNMGGIQIQSGSMDERQLVDRVVARFERLAKHGRLRI